MKINYNVTGAARKSLVGAVSQELNAPTKYLGMPTAGYEVGEYAIDKTGTLTGPDNHKLIAVLREEHGITTVAEEYDAPLLDSGLVCPDGCMDDRCVPGRVEDDILAIELAVENFIETASVNLEKLIASKAGMIRTALGVADLTVEIRDSSVRFPWFRETDIPELDAYMRFLCALCEMAKKVNRVTAKEKPVDNEKYAFRCFLLRLGFVGSEFKEVRKALLRRLTGNSSFKSGVRKQENAKPATGVVSPEA